MDLESWRYHCPRGHTNFDVEAAGIYCHGCTERGWPSWHHHVQDAKTGDSIDVRQLSS